MIESEKAVLLSIQPKWCELIASGRKTIEVRKTKPKLPTPFKCYIYCTMAGHKGKYLHTSNKHGQLLFWDNPKDTSITVQPENYDYMAYTCRGKVIGEFVCSEIHSILQIGNMNSSKCDYRAVTGDSILLNDDIFDFACLSKKDVNTYLKGQKGYGWHISDLKIYDKPKELSEFGLTRPPQSWCYVEKLEGEQ